MNRSAQPIGAQCIAAPFLVAVLGFGGGSSVARVAVDKSDTTFVTKAVATGMLEMQASQVAITRAGNPDVCALTQGMVRNHTTVGDEPKTLAGKKGIVMPGNLPANEHTGAGGLSALKDAKSDKAYAGEVGVKTHKEVISSFDKASKDAKDLDVKVFFAHNPPALREHLQMAEQLKTAVK